jgi:hypothetical protein
MLASQKKSEKLEAFRITINTFESEMLPLCSSTGYYQHLFTFCSYLLFLGVVDIYLLNVYVLHLISLPHCLLWTASIF